MKKFKFPSVKFTFKLPNLKNIHFRNRFGKTFPLNTSIISGWSEVIVYFVLVVVGIVLFYSWNQVRTQEWNIYMQQLEDGVAEGDSAAYDFVLSFPASFGENYAMGGLSVSIIDPTSWRNRSKSTLFVDTNYVVSGFGEVSEDGNYYPDDIRQIRQGYLDTLLSHAKKDSSFLALETDNIFYYCLSVRNDEISFFSHLIHGGIEKPKDKDKNMRQYTLQKKRKNGSNYYLDVNSLTAVKSHCQSSAQLIVIDASHTVPSYMSLYDLSCAYFKIKLQTDNICAKSLRIKYNGCAEFSTLYPEPDKMNYDYIYYNDELKLQYIQHNGLRFFAKFPELQNKQYVRTFALTAILSIFATTLLAFLLNAIFASFTFGRKKNEEAQNENPNDTKSEK